jgi:uncharacterized membrane protein YeaQ/YmgE (transglycosylase-associated protein family)
MHLLYTIIIGFIVGFIAKFLTPGREPGGFIITTLIGIGGALLAEWIGQAVGWYAPGQSAGFIASIIGAIILLAIYHLIKRATGGPTGRPH